jgi:hypothetical protein
MEVLEDMVIKDQCDIICHRKKKLEKDLKALRANFTRISSEFAIFVLGAASLYV